MAGYLELGTVGTPPIPDLNDVDRLFSLIDDEVDVTLRFPQQHSAEGRATGCWAGRARTVDRFEMVNQLEHLLEENLAMVGVSAPVLVDAQQGELGSLGEANVQAFFRS